MLHSCGEDLPHVASNENIQHMPPTRLDISDATVKQTCKHTNNRQEFIKKNIRKQTKPRSLGK